MNEKEIIAQIRELKDDEIQKWIDERISYLEKNTEVKMPIISLERILFRRELNNTDITEVHGFIPSSTEVMRKGNDASGIKIDDKDIYGFIVDMIRRSNNNDITKNSYIMNVIQTVIVHYFGKKGIASNRNKMYIGLNDFEDDKSLKSLSIKEFMGKETAMCTERSAVGQNLLAFLGYDPIMIYGDLSVKDSVVNEAHAFNCVIRGKTAMLVDFFHPVYKDGKLEKASCYKVDEEQLKKFLKGKGQIEVNHKKYHTENGEVIEEVTPYVYSSNEIEPTYFDKYKEEKLDSEKEVVEGMGTKYSSVNLTEKLGKETEIEQSDIISIDETESVKNGEIPKIREDIEKIE